MNGRSASPQVAAVMSKRLTAIADMLGEGADRGLKVADVGCDHGYVSIYLIQSGIAESCIAMDVKKAPLSRADANIREYGIDGDRISTRLSDGLKELKTSEADALVVAGMGGRLMMQIIGERDLRSLGIKRAVFQPQSELADFRQFLREKNYEIVDERVIFEDGKYYFPIRAEIGTANAYAALKNAESIIFSDENNLSDADRLRILNRWGEHNLMKKEPLLKPFLLHQRDICKSILKNLDDSHNERRREIEEELSDISFAIKYLGTGEESCL